MPFHDNFIFQNIFYLILGQLVVNMFLLLHSILYCKFQVWVSKFHRLSLCHAIFHKENLMGLTLKDFVECERKRTFILQVIVLHIENSTEVGKIWSTLAQ